MIADGRAVVRLWNELNSTDVKHLSDDWSVLAQVDPEYAPPGTTVLHEPTQTLWRRRDKE